jgi:membrane protein
VLGSIGLATLIFTVISQIQKIESALNYLWNVKTARSLAMRFSNYMSVLLIGPVLIFSALGLATSLMSTSFVHMLLSIEPFGTVIYLATKLIPFALVCAAFTFFYSSLPNTKVHLISALVGGVFAGLLWMTTGMVFTSFVVSSAQYSAVYSGFAVLILFLIWLYWSFLILLIGARVSFYHQYPQFIAVGSKRLDLSDRLKERLALFIMFLIGHSFYHSTRPWQFSSLTDRLGLPADAVHDVLRVLQGKRLIIPSGDEPPAYYPARDIEIIRVKEVIDAIRMAGEDSGTVESEFPVVPEIDAILRKVDEAVAGSLNSETIKDLVLSHKENV